MRTSVCFLLLLFGVRPAAAQTFFPLPEPVLAQEVAFDLATECYLFFENPSGDSLQLRWKRIDVSHPETWILDLCDFGLCYVGIPASGLMNPAAGTEQPYLKLIVQPGQTPGAAWLWFRVWADGDPTNYADVFFDLHTPGTTSAPEASERPRVRVFPNPTTGPLFLENPAQHAAPAQLLDAAGRMRWSGNLAPQAPQMLDLALWPAGVYFLKTPTGSQRVVRHTNP